MTGSRAFTSALATAGLMLGLAGPAQSQIQNDITGTNSDVDMACLGLLYLFTNSACSYNGGNWTAFDPFLGWTGPVVASAYYTVGDSPWDRNGVGTDPGQVPEPGDGKLAPPITGTVTIDDQGTPCDADDTIAATITVGAATRAFNAGNGPRGEETWDTLVFDLPATQVDAFAADGGGCNYEIGSAGFPNPELVLTSGAAYPADEDIVVGSYTAKGAIGVASFSTLDDGGLPGAPAPNVGATMTLQSATNYSCAENIGPCSLDGDHHDQTAGQEGALLVRENTLWSVSVLQTGAIDAASVYLNSEGANQFGDNWTGPVWRFTGTCNNCPTEPTAVDDSASAITSGPPVDIPILANDSSLVEDPANDIVTVNLIQDAQLAGASCVINGSPGLVADIDLTYTPGVNAGNDTCQYNVDTTLNAQPFTTNTADVNVTVEADVTPVAPDAAAPDIDTTGVAPETQTSVIDVAAIAGVDLGNAPSTVTITAQGALGNATVAGTVITYTPAATSFVGSDAYTYQVEDAQGDTDTGDITVDYVDSQPVAGDGTAQTDADVPVDVDVLPLIQAGNGEVSDHALAVTGATDGTAVLAGTIVTYTPDAGFVGDGTFTYSLDDADGDQDTGTVTITVDPATGDLTVKLPGGSSAMSPLSLLLLLGLPLLRRRRQG